MAVFRTQTKVPYVYPNESRDFQVFCRVTDYLTNVLRFDADEVVFLTNTMLISDRLLDLLKTKIGFFTQKEFDSVTLRRALNAFPKLVRIKGTEEAIREAVRVFLKINNLNTRAQLSITNKSSDPAEEYSIRIGIESAIRDVSILEELLRYIVPTGYIVTYYFYTAYPGANQPAAFLSKQNVTIIEPVELNTTSSVRSSSTIEDADIAVEALRGAVDTLNIYNNDETSNEET